MILTIGGIKGGSGKSVISCNLVVIRSMSNRVLFCDADEQGSSSDWVSHRNAQGLKSTWTTIRLRGSSVRTEILNMRGDYDDVIIDCGGRDTTSLRAAITISDKFIIPFKPSSFDIWTIGQVSQIIEDAKLLNPDLIVQAFINGAQTRAMDVVDARRILSKDIPLIDSVIHQRKAFENATSEGLSVTELATDAKAIAEILALYANIWQKIDNKETSQWQSKNSSDQKLPTQ